MTKFAAIYEQNLKIVWFPRMQTQDHQISSNKTNEQISSRNHAMRFSF